MNICFFSDKDTSNFKPLTLCRPFDDLRLGIFTIREKWIKILKPDSWIRQVDDYLTSVFPTGHILDDKEYIWLNTRFLPSKELIDSIQSLKLNQVLTFKEQIIAARLSSKETKSYIEFKTLPTKTFGKQINFDPVKLTHFWDLLDHNATQISFDIRLLPASFTKTTQFDSSVIIRKAEQVFVHETAVIEPGAILIAENGPIYIGPKAKIEAGSIIKGPVAICDKAEVKMGGRIFNGTTVGPVCKVGGEINNCIFHSFSNKAHDGFAGNSIIGQWCNFGADTNTSNLKNNYSKVRLPHWDSQMISDDGAQFFGTIFGDFSKTAINTSLNTGTICGVSANIFCTGFPKKFIPSFTWLGEESQIYEFDKAILAMRAMMKRRDIELTQEYINMMRYIFNLEYSSGS